MNAQFLNAWVLYLLWLVPLAVGLAALLRRRRERRFAQFISPPMQARLGLWPKRVRFALRAVLAAAGMALLLVAAARPQWGTRQERVYRPGRDIVIALDVSRSMLVADVYPNRLQRAKADIVDLIDALRGERVGLLAFRRRPAWICPLTTDYAFLREALDGASPDSAPAGETDVGDAVAVASAGFDAASSTRVVILVSDGEDLAARAAAAAAAAAGRGVRIFAVGVGTTQGGYIPDPDIPSAFVQIDGTNVVSRLRADSLRAIADATGGAYMSLGSLGIAGATLGALYTDDIRRIEAPEAEERVRVRLADRFQEFLLPGIALLIAAACLSAGRPPRRTRSSGRLASIGLAAVAAALARAEASEPARAGTPTDRYNAALSAYEAGDYGTAAATMEEMNAAAPRRPALMLLGAALYRQAQSSRAEDRAAIEQQVCLLRQAADAFRQACEQDAADADARYDLALAMRAVDDAHRRLQKAILLEQNRKTPPASLINRVLLEQREIEAAAQTGMRDPSPKRIDALDQAGTRETANAELCDALTALSRTAQAAPDPATLAALTAGAARMRRAAQGLRDLSPEATNGMRAAEDDLYSAWNAMASYPDVLTEAIRAQTNAIVLTRAATTDAGLAAGRAVQTEAGRLTELFTRRLPTPETAHMTPETHAKIAQLASLATEAQRRASDRLHSAPAERALGLQTEALEALKAIAPLLRSALPAGAGQETTQPQQRPPPGAEYVPEPEARHPTKPTEGSASNAPSAQPPPMDREQVDILLKRAAQREKEYLDRLHRRVRIAPSPTGRDW